MDEENTTKKELNAFLHYLRPPGSSRALLSPSSLIFPFLPLPGSAPNNSLLCSLRPHPHTCDLGCPLVTQETGNHTWHQSKSMGHRDRISERFNLARVFLSIKPSLYISLSHSSPHTCGSVTDPPPPPASGIRGEAPKKGLTFTTFTVSCLSLSLSHLSL